MNPIAALNKQAGSAIFMALFFVVLVTTISLSWYMQSRIAVKRLNLMLASDQAYLYAQGIRDLELTQLKTALDENQNGGPIPWPFPLNKELSTEKIQLYGSIDDYQSRLNLNNMAESETKTAFIRLISIIDPSIGTAEATTLATAVLAWISTENLLTSFMREVNDSYANSSPPYHAANRPMHSVSELRLIQGVSSKLYLALEPYLCALPPKTPTHFKHASTVILSAFNKAPSSLDSELPSEYYLIRAEISASNEHFLVYTLVHFDNDQKKSEAGIIWENRGTI